MRARALLRRLHLWLGLGIGLVFALVALSGTVLVFQRELLLAAHPELAAQPLPDPTQRGDALARIVAEWSPRGLRGLELPSPALPVWIVYAEDGWHYLAPADGRLLLTRTPDRDWLLWLRDLHTHLLAGHAGEQALGIAGLIALCLLGSGLYLWWPRRAAFGRSLRLHANPPPLRWLSWHRSPGALLLPLLLLVTATGTAMVYYGPTRAALRALFGDAPEPSPPPVLAPRPDPTDWNAVLTAAERALPDATLRRLAPPAPEDAHIVFRARLPAEWHPNGRSLIWVDPYTASVVQRHDATSQGAGARLSETIYPLHGGFVGGPGWKLAVAASGLLPPLLFVTGFLFWRARRRRRSTTTG